MKKSNKLLLTISFLIFFLVASCNFSDKSSVSILTFEESLKLLSEHYSSMETISAIERKGEWGSLPYKLNGKVYCTIFESGESRGFEYFHEYAHCEMSNYNLTNTTPIISVDQATTFADLLYDHGFEAYADIRATQLSFENLKEFNPYEIINKRKNDLCTKGSLKHWTSFYVESFISTEGYMTLSEDEIIAMINSKIDIESLRKIYQKVKSNSIAESSYCDK